MKGFLKKDLYLAFGYCRSLAFLAVVFLAASCFNSDNAFFTFYPVIVVSMVPSTLYSYDEREHFCAYAAVMPCARARYVSAKYLIGLLLGLVMLLLTLLAQLVHGLTGGTVSAGALVNLGAALLSLSLLAPAVSMPFMFRFGAEKGRLAYYVMIGCSCAAALLLMNQGNGVFAAGSVLFPALCLAAAAVYALSWYLSVRFYHRREF